jgi:hypothetical protein
MSNTDTVDSIIATFVDNGLTVESLLHELVYLLCSSSPASSSLNHRPAISICADLQALRPNALARRHSAVVEHPDGSVGLAVRPALLQDIEELQYHWSCVMEWVDNLQAVTVDITPAELDSARLHAFFNSSAPAAVVSVHRYDIPFICDHMPAAERTATVVNAARAVEAQARAIYPSLIHVFAHMTHLLRHA